MKHSSLFQSHLLNSSVSKGKQTGLQSNSLTMSDIQPRNNDELVAKKPLMLKPRRPLPAICSQSPSESLHTMDEVVKRKRRSDSISSNQNQSYNIFDSHTNYTPPRQTPRVPSFSETIQIQKLSLESPIALKKPSGSACLSAPPNKEGHHQSSLASPGKSSCSSFSSFVKSPSPLPKPRQRNASSSPPKASKRLTRLPLDHPNCNFTILIDGSHCCSSSSDDEEVSAITTPRDWARFPDMEISPRQQASDATMALSSPQTCGFQTKNSACTPKRTSTSERQSRNIVGACDFPSSIPDFPIMGCKDTFMVSNPHQDEGLLYALEPRGSLVDTKVCKHEKSRKTALLGTTVVINNVGFIPDTPYSSDTESDDGFFLAKPEHLLKEQDSESNITGVERRAKQIRRGKFSSPSESLFVPILYFK